ncbi:MAG: hypothetical protein DHS20C11_01600 [Lysobacteraceae bacterium]|nr:MAG: hypothetical protein DHS20C11_01600 [Xanthomonadaceae bacterium]
MVFRSPNQTQAWWTADQSGWEDAWDAKRVTAELMGKEEKAASYKRRCDEVWLAISIGKGQVATPISLT